MHSALEHSHAPGPGTLAGAGIRQHDEHTGRVLLIIQVKECKSKPKILNSQGAFDSEKKWETKQKPLQLSLDH